MAVDTPPDTREAILSAVERMLETRRLDELTVVDLIQAAGISRATFYMYFESKHAAVAARAEGVMDQIHDIWSPWLDRAGPGDAEALEQIWLDSIALWREHRALLMAAAEAWRADAVVSESWSGLMKHYAHTVVGHIERAQAAGTAPPSPDAGILATLLVWLNESALYLAFGSAAPAPEDDARLARALSAIWLRALYDSPSPIPPIVGLAAPIAPPAAPHPRTARMRRRGNVELRRAILDATAELLRERPLESLTALDVIEAAGFSKPTFYMYFGSKHAAVAEVADEMLGTIYEKVWRGAFEGDPAVGPPGAAEHWRATLGAWREHQPVLVAAAEGWRRDPAVYARWGVRMQSFVETMATYIDHAKAAGTAQPEPDSTTMAELLMWHAETVLYLALSGLAPELDDDVLLAETLSAVWLRAIHGGAPKRGVS
jgi:AcrR family transcriptional regulator